MKKMMRSLRDLIWLGSRSEGNMAPCSSFAEGGSGERERERERERLKDSRPWRGEGLRDAKRQSLGKQVKGDSFRVLFDIKSPIYKIPSFRSLAARMPKLELQTGRGQPGPDPAEPEIFWVFRVRVISIFGLKNRVQYLKLPGRVNFC